MIAHAFAVSIDAFVSHAPALVVMPVAVATMPRIALGVAQDELSEAGGYRT